MRPHLQGAIAELEVWWGGLRNADDENYGGVARNARLHEQPSTGDIAKRLDVLERCIALQRGRASTPNGEAGRVAAKQSRVILDCPVGQREYVRGGCSDQFFRRYHGHIAVAGGDTQEGGMDEKESHVLHLQRAWIKLKKMCLLRLQRRCASVGDYFVAPIFLKKRKRENKKKIHRFNIKK